MLSHTPWSVTPLQASLHIAVHETINPLCHTHQEDIAHIWEKKTTQHPTLYNGRVFCVDRLTSTHIEGHWNEFKNVLAQMTRPDLFAENPLKSLAVVGLFHATDGIVIGKRSARSIYLPGYWQGIPAGSVETRDHTTAINLTEQLQAEAHEELGLTPEEIDIGPPLLACEHPNTHIIDIGVSIHSPLSFRTIEERCKTEGNAEYDALTCLNLMQKTSFDGLMVPTLRALLEHT
ncbi:NUDIX hydrolase [Neokomagataea thailandica]|uniref:Phosphohydrolase n=1 Tax=Neokomagataea tanensis NBRC 106556 TaxID=1223519 RepID=A0ABQ0QIX2_9PROT|nr:MULTISPECIES: hypothetical protein [Neokomagataea]GBR46407.1 phosphohydrolase [Neokomagataea tanensis NBRC 106556]